MGCPFCEALSRKELVEKNRKKSKKRRLQYGMGMLHVYTYDLVMAP